jgi:hypothetical protein
MSEVEQSRLVFTGTLEDGTNGLFTVAPDRVASPRVRHLPLEGQAKRPPGAAHPVAVDRTGRVYTTFLYEIGDTTAERLIRLQSDGSGIEVLRDERDYMIRGVAVDLEGNRIAMSLCEESGQPTRLVLVDEAGKTTVVSGLDDVWSVAMAPDGSAVFCEAIVDGHADTYRVPWGGREAERAFEAGPDGDRYGCSVSPCSRYLAVNNVKGEADGIQVVDADGRHPRRISFAGAVEKRPCWSPTGDYVAIVVGMPPSMGDQGIALLSADGSEPIASLLPPGWRCDGKLGREVDSVAWWAPTRGRLDLPEDLVPAGELARVAFLEESYQHALEMTERAHRQTPRVQLQRVGILKALVRHAEAVAGADGALVSLESPLDRNEAHELKILSLDQLDDLDGALAATRADEDAFDWPDARCFRHAVRAYLYRQLALCALREGRQAVVSQYADEIRSNLAVARKHSDPEEEFTRGLIEEQTEILRSTIEPALARKAAVRSPSRPAGNADRRLPKNDVKSKGWASYSLAMLFFLLAIALVILLRRC